MKKPYFGSNATEPILKRLRNIFVHTNGDYNCTNEEHKKLRDLIIKRFNTKPLSTEKEDFTLDIGTFLEPVTLKCIEHVEENYDIKPVHYKPPA